MRLYFFRHGPAGSRAQWEGDDSLRPLTDEGTHAVALVAKHLAGIGVTTDAIVSSPYVRADATARIAADALGCSVGTEASLAPGFDVRDLERLLSTFPNAETLMLVGHEPDFSFVISELIGGGRVVMKKGGVARVDLDGRDLRSGRLAWLISPASVGS